MTNESQTQTDLQARARCAIIVPHTFRAGAEVVVENFLQSLSQRTTGIEIHLIAPVDQPLYEVAKSLGFITHKWSFPRYLSTSVEINNRRFFNPVATFVDFLLVFYQAFMLRRLLRKEKISVIYSGSMMAHILCSFVGIFTATKVVCHIQDIVSPKLLRGIGRSFLRALLRAGADSVVVPTHAVAEPLLPNERVEVIPLGLDLQRFSPEIPSSFRSELQVPPDVMLVGAVGRLTYWKGQHVLLDAVEHLGAPGAKARIVIVGDALTNDGTYRDQLHSYVRTQGLDDQVTFTGFRKDVANILRALDVVVVPSVMPDPSPLAVLEAMACGKPVLGSRIGGIPELIVQGETGLLFESGDAQQLAECILTLLRDPGMRDEYGKAGRKRIEERYTLEQFTANLSAIFLSLASSKM